MRASFLVLASVALFACSDALNPKDNAGSAGSTAASPDGVGTAFGTSLCQRFSDCALSTCDASEIAPIILSKDCQSSLLSVACADLQATVQGCLPPCSPAGTATCNTNGTLTECTTSGFNQTVSCAGVCAVKGMTYSGTCGLTFNKMTSHVAACWCQ